MAPRSLPGLLRRIDLDGAGVKRRLSVMRGDPSRTRTWNPEIKSLPHKSPEIIQEDQSKAKTGRERDREDRARLCSRPVLACSVAVWRQRRRCSRRRLCCAVGVRVCVRAMGALRRLPLRVCSQRVSRRLDWARRVLTSSLTSSLRVLTNDDAAQAGKSRTSRFIRRRRPDRSRDDGARRFPRLSAGAPRRAAGYGLRRRGRPFPRPLHPAAVVS